MIIRQGPSPNTVPWKTGGGHYFVLVGEDSSGTLYTVDSASRSVRDRYINSGGIDAFVNCVGSSIREILVPDQAPDGSVVTNSEGTAEFTGFEGGETVVAPVTGEVIEYGTTKRKNIEVEKAKENDQLVEDIELAEEEVGFIKIRVLGNKVWKQSRSKEGCGYFSGTPTKQVENAITAQDVEDNKAGEWLDNKYGEEYLKTLGYDYFWQEYNDAGIGDYILYLEGFDVSDIGVSGNKKENITKLGEFIKTLEDDSDALDNPDELANNYTTQYTVSNLLDDKREYELKVAEEAKKKAAYTITKDGKIYIKEGAAIGKTYKADSEFIKEIEIEEPESEEENNNEQNNNAQNNPANPTPDPNAPADQNDPNAQPENTGPYTVGNYLKMIFRDTDQQVVENVEEYVETEEAAKSTSEVEWELLYFLPYESGPIGKPGSGPEAVNTTSGATTGNFDVGIIQWTTNNRYNHVGEFCKKAAERNPSLCGDLTKYASMDQNQIRQQSVRDDMQNTFTEICNKDREGFLQVQTEIAKEEYLGPITLKNPWLAESPLVVQGTIMSVTVLKGAETDIPLIQGNDSGNIATAIAKIAGSKLDLSPRRRGQGNAANDILNKKVSESEIKEWVNTKVSPASASDNWGEH